MTAPANSAGVDGAGVALLRGQTPCVTITSSCDNESTLARYTDQGITDNNITVRTTYAAPNEERIRIVDPGVLVVPAGLTCSGGLGSGGCTNIYVYLDVHSGDGDDVITLQGNKTRAFVDCGPGHDKVVIRWGASGRTQNCEKVV